MVHSHQTFLACLLSVEFETLSQPLPIPTDVGRCPGSSSSQLSKISFLQQPVVVTDKSIGSHPNLETARKPALSTQASVGGYGTFKFFFIVSVLFTL